MSRIATAYKQHLVQCLHVSNFYACEFGYTANREQRNRNKKKIIAHNHIYIKQRNDNKEKQYRLEAYLRSKDSHFTRIILYLVICGLYIIILVVCSITIYIYLFYPCIYTSFLRLRPQRKRIQNTCVAKIFSCLLFFIRFCFEQ